MDDFSKVAAERKKVKDEYRKVLLSGEGKNVLLDLLQFCHVLTPVYSKGDPEQSAFNEGQRSVGLMLLDVLDVRGYKDLIELEQRGIDLLKLGDV